MGGDSKMGRGPMEGPAGWTVTEGAGEEHASCILIWVQVCFVKT